MSNLLLCFSLALLIVITVACGGGESQTNTLPPKSIEPDFSKLTTDCFVPDKGNPVIKSGDFTAAIKDITGATNWNDPHVVRVGDEYWMYASSDDNFDLNIRIYRLVSKDLTTWSVNPDVPVLTHSISGFDSHSVETPAVVYFNSRYHLFWTGYADPNDIQTFKIGHAVSPDGINFIKDDDFVIGPDANYMLTAEPAPVVVDGHLYLYFTALTLSPELGLPLQVISLISSSDGVNWSKPEVVLEPEQSIYPRVSPDYFLGYSTPHAMFMGNKVHLFFNVIQTDASETEYEQVRLHHATSTNGITFWQHAPKHIFARTDALWTADRISSPAGVLTGRNLHLWYGGHTLEPSPVLGVGVAICKL